jgi:NTE family protein
VVGSFVAEIREGTYWSVRSDVNNYSASKPLHCPFEKTTRLANVATRLKRLDDHTQEALINWGYSICDAAMRTWVDKTIPEPAGFPYPETGVG